MPVQDKASTITTDLGSGESLRVGDVVIELLEKSGKRARLQAPRGKRHREEDDETSCANHGNVIGEQQNRKWSAGVPHDVTQSSEAFMARARSSGVNDPKAVKRFSGLLAYDASMKSYFDQRSVGAGAEEVPIQILTDLESDAGEQIAFDLLAEMKMAPVEGEDNLEGKEAQKFFTDTIYIDQARWYQHRRSDDPQAHAAQPARETRRQQSSWGSPARRDWFILPVRRPRHHRQLPVSDRLYGSSQQLPLTAPDTAHLIYGGNATAKNNMTNEGGRRRRQ